MAILYNFEIKLNQLFGGVGYVHGTSANKDGYSFSPSLHDLFWQAESHTPGSSNERHSWGQVGGKGCWPLSITGGRTGKSDHKISCDKMTSGERKCIKMIRENGIQKQMVTRHSLFLDLCGFSLGVFSWNSFTYFSNYFYSLLSRHLPTFSLKKSLHFWDECPMKPRLQGASRMEWRRGLWLLALCTDWKGQHGRCGVFSVCRYWVC